MKYLYVTLIVPASVILPIGAGLFKRVYHNRSISMLFFYLIFVVLTGIAALITVKHNINNLPLLHLYTVAEFLFILRYFQLIFNTPNIVRFIKMLMIVFPVLAILNFIFVQNIYSFNSYPRPIAALIIVGLCMHYFFLYSGDEIKKQWAAQPTNWIVAGLLMYFSAAFLYFAFANIIHQHASLAMRIVFGNTHATFVMLMYILFSIGFLQVKNER
jgi:hypothetical protein